MINRRSAYDCLFTDMYNRLQWIAILLSLEHLLAASLPTDIFLDNEKQALAQTGPNTKSFQSPHLGQLEEKNNSGSFQSLSSLKEARTDGKRSVPPLAVQKRDFHARLDADDSDSSSDIISSEADEGSSDSEHESDELEESSEPQSEDDEGSFSSDGEFPESTVESSEEEEDDPSESVDDVFGEASEVQEEGSEETEEKDVNSEEFTEPPRDSEIDSDET
ncbi:ribosome biogenesis protein ERB1-like [Ixodes scapularis]|uniref:ribosome biogenesis protein ERB1-like n=1 Tax=Ixodes scapularis TaxID=6945 RepID=UPI001C394900|nr:ribosome biogenesis protein ERB1-like [Ixodes scapularis]